MGKADRKIQCRKNLQKLKAQGNLGKQKKTKAGGSSGGLLINEVVKERVKGDVIAEPRATGGVPSLKVPRTRAKRVTKIT